MAVSPLQGIRQWGWSAFTKGHNCHSERIQTENLMVVRPPFYPLSHDSSSLPRPWIDWYKRSPVSWFTCTVNTVNFVGLIFHVWWHKNIFAALRVVKFVLSRCSLVIFVSCTKLTSFNDTCKFTSNWAAQKQSRPHTCSNILPISINTHGQYTTPMCLNVHVYKISQIFLRALNSRLLNFASNSRKLPLYGTCSYSFD